MTVACAAIAQIALTRLLVLHRGVNGSALAYAVAICGMYGNFSRMAHRELMQLMSQGLTV